MLLYFVAACQPLALATAGRTFRPTTEASFCWKRLGSPCSLLQQHLPKPESPPAIKSDQKTLPDFTSEKGEGCMENSEARWDAVSTNRIGLPPWHEALPWAKFKATLQNLSKNVQPVGVKAYRSIELLPWMCPDKKLGCCFLEMLSFAFVDQGGVVNFDGFNNLFLFQVGWVSRDWSAA